MNRPLGFVCACISGIGLLILAYSIYGTVMYGHGNMEAGNCTQYDYVTMGDGRRDFVEPPTGERHPLIMSINTWMAGGIIGLIGVGLFLWDASENKNRPF